MPNIDAFTRITAVLFVFVSPVIAHESSAPHDHEIECRQESVVEAPSCKKDMESCIKEERLRLEKSGAVGIVYVADRDGSDRVRGMKVLRVVENSPAQKAGLHSGETITSWNGKTVSETTQQDFGRYHSQMTKGRVTDYSVLDSEGQTRSLRLEAAGRTSDSVDIALSKFVWENFGCSAYKKFYEDHDLGSKISPLSRP